MVSSISSPPSIGGLALAVMLSFVGSPLILAQRHEMRSYNGPWDDGYAQYSYYLDPETGRRIIDGQFHWQQRTYVSLYTKDGQYANGSREGKWTYRISGSAESGGRSLQVESLTTGAYRNDRPHGKWTIDTRANGSDMGMNGIAFVHGEAQFNDGRFVGKFTYQYRQSRREEYAVTGQFDASGWMDGKWTITYLYRSTQETRQDVRQFRHGFLASATIGALGSHDDQTIARNSIIIDRLNQLDTAESRLAFEIAPESHPPDYVHRDNQIDGLAPGSAYLAEARRGFVSKSSDITTWATGFELRDIEPSDSKYRIEKYGKEIARSNGRSWLDYLRRAEAYADSTLYSLADSDYTRVLELDATYVWAHRDRAWVRFKRGDCAAAVEDAMIYVNREPNDAQTQAYLGWYLFSCDRYAESIEASRKALKLDKTLMWAQFDLGIALLCSGDAGSAHIEYKRGKKRASREEIQEAIRDLEDVVDRGVAVEPALEALKRIFDVDYVPNSRSQ